MVERLISHCNSQWILVIFLSYLRLLLICHLNANNRSLRYICSTAIAGNISEKTCLTKNVNPSDRNTPGQRLLDRSIPSLLMSWSLTSLYVSHVGYPWERMWTSHITAVLGGGIKKQKHMFIVLITEWILKSKLPIYDFFSHLIIWNIFIIMMKHREWYYPHTSRSDMMQAVDP